MARISLTVQHPKSYVILEDVLCCEYTSKDCLYFRFYFWNDKRLRVRFIGNSPRLYYRTEEYERWLCYTWIPHCPFGHWGLERTQSNGKCSTNLKLLRVCYWASNRLIKDTWISKTGPPCVYFDKLGNMYHNTFFVISLSHLMTRNHWFYLVLTKI